MMILKGKERKLDGEKKIERERWFREGEEERKKMWELLQSERRWCECINGG